MCQMEMRTVHMNSRCSHMPSLCTHSRISGVAIFPTFVTECDVSGIAGLYSMLGCFLQEKKKSMRQLE